MRKLLTLVMIFACMITFVGCNDDEKEKELKSVKYTIEALFDENFTGIAIWEEGESKEDILKTNSLYELKAGEKKSYTSAKGCKSVTIYAKGDNLGFFKQEEVFFDEKKDIMLGAGIIPITAEEYDFYTR